MILYMISISNFLSTKFNNICDLFCQALSTTYPTTPPQPASHPKKQKKTRIEIKTDQIRSHQIKSDQIRSNQIKSDQIRSNQIRSNQINSDQIGSNQIKSDQIRSDQIRTSPYFLMNFVSFSEKCHGVTASFMVSCFAKS